MVQDNVASIIDGTAGFTGELQLKLLMDRYSPLLILSEIAVLLRILTTLVRLNLKVRTMLIKALLTLKFLVRLETLLTVPKMVFLSS